MQARPLNQQARHVDPWLFWMLGLALAAGALFPLSSSLAARQDADGILPALISTQKLTWYYWGQDRFLNFLPALAKPLVEISWNLKFQIFLRALFSFLAPLGISYFLSTSARINTITVVLTNLVLGLALSQTAKLNLYVFENPFGTSLALLALSLYLFRRGPQRPLFWVLAGLVSFIAYATNIALLIIAFPVIITALLLKPPQRPLLLRFFLLQVIALSLAYWHSRVFGIGRTSLAPANPSFSLILEGFAHVSADVAWGPLLTFAGLSVYLAFKARIENTSFALLLIFGSFLLTAALSLSKWLQMNDYNIRYFLPIVILFTSSACYLFASSLYTKIRNSAIEKSSALCIVAAEFFLLLGGFSHRPFAVMPPDWQKTSLSIANAAHDHHARALIGNYWTVWPAVYEYYAAYGKSETNRSLYGVTLRSMVLRQKIKKAQTDSRGIVALCLLDEIEACTQNASSMLSLSISVVPDSVQSIEANGKRMLVMNILMRDP